MFKFVCLEPVAENSAERDVAGREVTEFACVGYVTETDTNGE